MAQGGMQISVAPEDSPVTHFVDTLKGGHMQNDHQLLKVMVEEGPRLRNGCWGWGCCSIVMETGTFT
jgi:Aspartate oxidase